MEYNSAIAVLINGKKIGCVQNSDKALETEQFIYSSVYGTLDGIMEIKFEETLVFGEVFEPSQIVEIAFDDVDGVEEVYGLFVDGMLTAVAESEDEIQTSLNELIDVHSVDGAEFIGYANSVEINKVFVTFELKKDLVTTVDGYLDGRTGVQVITSRVENYDEEILYETVVVYDVSRVSGYNKVVKKAKMVLLILRQTLCI